LWRKWGEGRVHFSLTNQQKAAIKELAGIAGGLSAVAMGEISGNQSNKEIADNVWSGSRIGKNAAENNYLMPKEKMAKKKEMEKCGDNLGCNVMTKMKYNDIDSKREHELFWDFDKNKEDVRQEFTNEGDGYFKDNKKEFVKLPDKEAIFHTYPRNEKDEIQTSGKVEGYEKYVHPTYGYEVIIDTNNNDSIVTDPVNRGTYNFTNDSESTVGHFTNDIAPYFIYGTGKVDDTTVTQRLGRNLEFFNN
jgi:hypothetical protein